MNMGQKYHNFCSALDFIPTFRPRFLNKNFTKPKYTIGYSKEFLASNLDALMTNRD